MKVIILAGGYAKRMWPLTRNKPKHLLPIGKKPMLDYVIKKFNSLGDIDQIYISTNAKFKDIFEEYLDSIEMQKDITLFIEETSSEKEKLGSVGALGYLIQAKNIAEEMIVIGGDNIFGFNMIDFINFFRLKKGNAVAVYNLKSQSKASLYGVVTLDRNNKIIDFEEKPLQPKTTLISTACYAFTKKGVLAISNYLEKNNDPDKIGSFIEWLCKKQNVFGFIFEEIWFDVGSLDSYSKANEYFTKKNSKYIF